MTSMKFLKSTECQAFGPFLVLPHITLFTITVSKQKYRYLSLFLKFIHSFRYLITFKNFIQYWTSIRTLRYTHRFFSHPSNWTSRIKRNHLSWNILRLKHSKTRHPPQLGGPPVPLSDNDARTSYTSATAVYQPAKARARQSRMRWGFEGPRSAS